MASAGTCNQMLHTHTPLLFVIKRMAERMLWRSLLERCLLLHLIKIPYTSHFLSSTFLAGLPRYLSRSPWSRGECNLVCCDLWPLPWVYSIPLLPLWKCDQYLQSFLLVQSNLTWLSRQECNIQLQHLSWVSHISTALISTQSSFFFTTRGHFNSRKGLHSHLTSAGLTQEGRKVIKHTNNTPLLACSRHARLAGRSDYNWEESSLVFHGKAGQLENSVRAQESPARRRRRRKSYTTWQGKTKTLSPALR